MADNGQDYFKREPPFKAFFPCGEEHTGGVWHAFPTTVEALKEALESAGRKLELGAPLEIGEYHSEIPGLEKHLPKRVDPDELNYLAATLQVMPLSELAVFRGALDEGLYCDSVQSLINMAGNIEEWMDAPEVFTDTQHGRFLYDNGILPDEECEAAEIQIKTSYCPDKFFGEIGEKYRLSHGGFFTAYGYTENLGVIEIKIPEESRLFAMADAALFPFHKAENIDIADFVMKAHALAGEYTNDAEYNLRALAEGQGADYLLLMDAEHANLMETDFAYFGSTATNSAARFNEGTEVSAFLLHYEHGNEGRSRGNVVVVDYAALKQDIDRHAIYFNRVEALMKDGTQKTFTRNEYQSLEQIERDKIRTSTYRYDPADVSALESHIKEYCEQAAGAARAVPVNDILETLNRSFMEQAEISNPDMLRIPLRVAKDMILGSHAPVYRLMPTGAAELGPKDVILSGGGLWYQFNREFALKKSDCWDGLNKWSKAAVARILPNRQHDVKKNHDAR